MEWTDADEQIYRALALEERLSVTGGTRSLESTYGAAFPCTVRTVTLVRSQRDLFWIKLRKHWYGDPLNGWIIIQVILWIPANIVYFA